MNRINILILNENPNETERIFKLCQIIGSVNLSNNLENAISLLKSTNFNILVVNSSLANYSFFTEILKKTTSIIITGTDEKKIKETEKEWPLDFYVDYHLTPYHREDNEGFLRTLNRAAEYSMLRNEVERLSRSINQSDIELKKDASSEIKEIKDLISGRLVKELERRVTVEKKYISFKRKKQKTEDILRKLYTAKNVSGFLDIAFDIKKIVHAESISLYILDKNETQGIYLAPLVWNNGFLSYPDFSKHIVLIHSQDFAASAARDSQEINVTDFSVDKRMSQRYTEKLKIPLKSLLCVPIVHKKEVIGVLEVYNKIHKEDSDKGGFTKEDQHILRELANQIAIDMTRLNLIQYDALTGLLRPDFFFDIVLQRLKLYRRRRKEEESYAMVVGDIDWFKHYNDRNGQEAGNKLLRELANVLNSQIREEDLLCRYGGEEFLFFLSGIKDVEEALHLTGRIRKTIEIRPFEHQEFQPRNNLTMSFGVTHFTGERFDSLKSITKNELKNIANEADKALLSAKDEISSGSEVQENDEPIPVKNTICVYRRKETDEAEKVEVIEPYEEKFPQERRKFERYYTSTVMIYKIDNVPKVTKTINLSLEGTMISSGSKLPLDQTLDLILILGNSACHLKGKVVYSEKVEGKFIHYNSGLKFENILLSDRKALQDYFSSLNIDLKREEKGSSQDQN